jgi:F-type H+-transporting ATPase subunit alpha
MPIEEQVASIYAGTQGFVDANRRQGSHSLQAAMLSYLRSDDVLKTIRGTKMLDDDTAAAQGR